MRKIEIEGKTFTLLNRDEVTYGAEKHLERAQMAAMLAMLSNKDVEELALKSKAKGDNADEEEGKNIDEDEFMNRVISGEIKEALLNSQEASITPEEEAIILSVGISREELLKMSSKVVKQLAVAALEELGPAEDFSEASDTDTN